MCFLSIVGTEILYRYIKPLHEYTYPNTCNHPPDIHTGHEGKGSLREGMRPGEEQKREEECMTIVKLHDALERRDMKPNTTHNEYTLLKTLKEIRIQCTS